jgi:hypothetical protein
MNVGIRRVHPIHRTSGHRHRCRRVEEETGVEELDVKPILWYAVVGGVLHEPASDVRHGSAVHWQGVRDENRGSRSPKRRAECMWRRACRRFPRCKHVRNSTEIEPVSGRILQSFHAQILSREGVQDSIDCQFPPELTCALRFGHACFPDENCTRPAPYSPLAPRPHALAPAGTDPSANRPPPRRRRRPAFSRRPETYSHRRSPPPHPPPLTAPLDRAPKLGRVRPSRLHLTERQVVWFTYFCTPSVGAERQPQSCRAEERPHRGAHDRRWRIGEC